MSENQIEIDALRRRAEHAERQLHQTKVRLDALEAELVRSGNYIANLEVSPTFIVFANKRTVKIVNGALEVGWLDDRDEEIAGPIAWKYAVGIKGSLALEQKAENERLRQLVSSAPAYERDARVEIERLRAELATARKVLQMWKNGHPYMLIKRD